MKRPGSPRRRVVVLVLASLLACLDPLWDTALANDSTVAQPSHSEMPSSDQAPQGKPLATGGAPSGAAAGKAQGDVHFETHLTVTVTGKDPSGTDRPIQGAEVKILSPPGLDAEPRTDAEGRATFTLTGPGAAKVRVIAEGWESKLAEVKLEEGKRRLNVPLTPLAEGKD